MNILDYYVTHGTMTDPQEQKYFYLGLGKDLSNIKKLIYNITIHFQYIRECGGKDVIGRINEIYIRKTSDRLKTLHELGVTSLSAEHSFLQKTICTCRDFALLLCSMLRHAGIPSRVRYGFAQYLDWDPSFFFDHTIVEYWDKASNSWKLAERHLTKEVEKRFNITFDTNDVPREKFISAAEAWLNCQSGKADAKSFGTGYTKRRSGLWYIRNKLIQDLAALNKMEMQPSDLWGYMIDGKIRAILSPDETEVMNRLAVDLLDPDENFHSLQNTYLNNPGLKVENQVYRARMNGKYVLEEISQ
jgi:hypothetical protein